MFSKATKSHDMGCEPGTNAVIWLNHMAYFDVAEVMARITGAKGGE